jgi:hypothetical protein
MPSTYSPSLKIELIGDGEQSGTWGQTTNTNLGTLLEQAIAGVISIAMPDTDYTLTSFNGASDEARNAVLKFTGSLSATRNVIVPTQKKVYIAYNTTNQSLVIKTSAGTGVTIPANYQTNVWCDGTNVVSPAYTFPSTVNSVGGFIGSLTGTASNATNATNATNLTGGTMAASVASITSAAPTLAFTDTDGLDYSIVVNSNVFYVLNQSGSAVIQTDQSGNFTATANVTAYSDERLKSDIRTLPAALDTVDQLRGVSFVKDGKANIGVIAQEVQKVLPQLVHEGADGYLSVAYGNLVGVLIEAVKELRAEVNALKGK